MSEEHSSPDGSNGNEGSPPTLHSVESGTIPGHEALSGPVFLHIDDTSMHDDELSEHLAYVERVLPEYLKSQRFLEVTEEAEKTILTDPTIIIRTLFAELGIQADLNELRLSSEERADDDAYEEGPSDDDKATMKHALEIEKLFRTATDFLETKAQQLEHYRFIRFLDEYIEKNHENATVLRACELLSRTKEKSTDRLTMIITTRILKTMLYINDAYSANAKPQ